MSVTPPLECLTLHEFPYKTVAAGETAVILDYHVTGGYVAFIERISCDLPHEEETSDAIRKMWHEFIVDGVPEKILYEIPIREPRVYDPPIVAHGKVGWRFYNADTKAHIIGVLVEGRLCKIKT